MIPPFATRSLSEITFWLLMSSYYQNFVFFWSSIVCISIHGALPLAIVINICYSHSFWRTGKHYYIIFPVSICINTRLFLFYRIESIFLTLYLGFTFGCFYKGRIESIWWIVWNREASCFLMVWWEYIQMWFYVYLVEYFFSNGRYVDIEFSLVYKFDLILFPL